MKRTYEHGHKSPPYAENSVAVNRPVRIPGKTEYDLALARDLCRNQRGVDWEKAKRLPFLPLFFVATNGLRGIDAAVRAQYEWERRAA